MRLSSIWDKTAVPVTLTDRLGDETVDCLERAAHERYKDARVLQNANRRLEAIYLYGYCCEIAIKAAYFRTIGFVRGDTIGVKDRKLAMIQMRMNTPIRTNNQHHIAG